MIDDPVKVILTNYPEGQTEECEIENNKEVREKFGTERSLFPVNFMWREKISWKFL